MLEVLHSNAIPILCLNKLAGKYKVSVAPASENIKYTAISHVWADGLGNKARNGLRQCQVKYIYELLESLLETPQQSNKEGYFVWIDTMCCPVDAPDSKAKAIALMRDTYANAENVLVLDAELETTSVEDLDIIENMVRVVCSTWMQRLWTLQEAFFAQRLWIQFQDAAVNLDSVVAKSICLPKTAKNRPFFNIGISTIASIRQKPKHFATSEYKHELTLASSVPGRSVSAIEDEAICLSSVLNLAMERVVYTQAAERMQEFWRLLSDDPARIPRRVLFGNIPRLKAKGFGWAPSTVLKLDSETSLQPDGGVLELNASGLVFTYPGFRLTSISLAAEYSAPVAATYLRDEEGFWYLMRFVNLREMGTEFSSLTREFWKITRKAENGFAQSLSEECHMYAIIVQQGPYYGRSSLPALVVKVQEDQNKTLFVKRVRPCIIRSILDATHSRFNETLCRYVGKIANAKTGKVSDIETARKGVSEHPIFQKFLSSWADPAEQLLSMGEWMLEDVTVLSGYRLPTTQKWCME